MCGRFAGSEPAEVLARRFHARSTIVWQGSDDCRPTQQLPVVVSRHQQRWLRLATWGLRFDWSKRPIINARVETAASKRSFAPLWRQHRCLVPATAFYEWCDGARQRCHLPDSGCFAMAGLWQVHADSGHFTILTTAANTRMRAIHERMPVILTPDQEETWLSGALQEICRPVACDDLVVDS